MAIFDLHLHTCWSYDAFSRPADYFRFAAEKNEKKEKRHEKKTGFVIRSSA